MSVKKWVAYLVRCADNSLYCGISKDFDIRLREHNAGKGAKYTRSRRPVKLVAISSEMTKSQALKLEYRIKRLPANQKSIELSRRENLMTISKKDLQALKKDIKAIEKKMDKLIAAAEMSRNAKAIKKAPAKKGPSKKKTAQPTAADQVLALISQGTNKGTDTATIMAKTGFNNKKVSNIIHRIYKQGKIKRVGKGLYAGA
jgi:putative endonuclease